MKLTMRAAAKKVTLITTAFVLAVSTLTASVPFILSKNASADSVVHTTNLASAGWNLGETRSAGHNELVSNGLHVWTTPSGGSYTNEFSKAAGYHAADFPLSAAGTTSIEIAPGYSGVRPSLQLGVDKDGNGSWDGYLVYEPWSYGEGNFWSSKDFGISSGLGYTSFGTLAQYSAANPSAKVIAIGYSLGSGVVGDATITKLSAGGVNYTFERPAPVDVYVDDDYTSASAGGHTWGYDAFARIQDGINAAGTNGTVHLANGTYTEKVAFTKSNVKLVGESKTNTIIKPLSNDYGMGLTTEGASNVTISNVTVNANSTSGGSAVKFSNSANITLKDAVVEGNNTYIRGVDVNGVSGVVIENVEVKNFGKNGIVFTAKYDAASPYTTGNVRLTNVTSNQNGWFGVVFYNLSSTGFGANIQNVQFTGTNTISNNLQAGFGVIGNTDAAYGAGTAPVYTVTGPSGAALNLGNTSLSGNATNIVNYQTTDLLVGGTTIDGLAASSMTAPQIVAAQSKIIDRNDNASYGRVFLINQTAPVVNFVSPTPADGAVVRGSVTSKITATDDYGMGGYFIRFWKDSYEVAGGGTLVANCGNVPGAFLLGTSVTDTCSFNTASVPDGTKLILSAQVLDGDNTWGEATRRTITVDNTAPVITVKTGDTSTLQGTLGSDPYDHVSFKLYDAAGNLKEVELNGHIYSRGGQWNDLNWSNINASHLNQGANTIIIRDKAGNESSLTFNYDSVAPAAPVINAAPIYVGSADAYKLANWTHDGTDVDHFEYREYMSLAAANADADGNTASYWIQTKTSAERAQTVGQSWTGEQTLYYRVVAVDALGHRSTPSALGTVIVDKNAPTAVLGFPTIGATGTSFTVQYSEAVNAAEASDPANYFLNNWIGAGGSGDLDGDAVISYNPVTFKATVTFTTPGWYVSPEQQWGVQNIHDLAGNLLSPNATTAYSTPNDAPGTVGVPTTSSPTNNLTSVWTWTAAVDPNGENGSGIKEYQYSFAKAGDAHTVWTSTTDTTATTVAPEDGSYNLYVRAIDNAGNIGGEVAGTVVIDTTAPVVDVDSGATAARISGTVDDPDATLAIIVDGNDPVALVNDNSTWTYTFAAPLTPGVHTISIGAVDTFGNPSAVSYTLTIPVPPAAPAPTTTEQTPEAPAATVTQVTPSIVGPTAFAAILGANAAGTTGDDTTDGTEAVEGTSTEKNLAAAVDTDSTDGTVLGMAWYWWLLILAALAAIIWWIVAAIRNRQTQN